MHLVSAGSPLESDPASRCLSLLLPAAFHSSFSGPSRSREWEALEGGGGSGAVPRRRPSTAGARTVRWTGPGGAQGTRVGKGGTGPDKDAAGELEGEAQDWNESQQCVEDFLVLEDAGLDNTFDAVAAGAASARRPRPASGGAGSRVQEEADEDNAPRTPNVPYAPAAEGISPLLTYEDLLPSSPPQAAAHTPSPRAHPAAAAAPRGLSAVSPKVLPLAERVPEGEVMRVNLSGVFVQDASGCFVQLWEHAPPDVFQVLVRCTRTRARMHIRAHAFTCVQRGRERTHTFTCAEREREREEDRARTHTSL